MSRVRLLVVGIASASLMAGCAMAPKPLQGQFAPLDPQAATAAAAGSAVRWGGTIAEVEPRRDRTCFQIVGHSLTSLARPRDDDHSIGRFIACRTGFYDPEVFAPGREVTVAGRIEGTEMRRIGEYEYRQPVVAADVVYLWPQRPDVEIVHDPFLRPYGPWYPYTWHGPWRRWP